MSDSCWWAIYGSVIGGRHVKRLIWAILESDLESAIGERLGGRFVRATCMKEFLVSAIGGRNWWPLGGRLV